MNKVFLLLLLQKKQTLPFLSPASEFPHIPPNRERSYTLA